MKQKTPLVLNKSRWLAYTVASGATAFTLPPAEGSIHYSGKVNVDVGLERNSHVTFQLDRPGDSIFFERVSASHFNSLHALAGFKAVGQRSGFFVGTGPDISTYCFIYPLRSGYNVTRARHLGMGAAYRSGFGKLAFLSTSGRFEFPGTYFLGFTFNNGSGRQYGWARVQMRGQEKNNSFKVVDYAYGDPGDTVLVGQTGDPSSPGAEESLGALAFGAAGLTAWRKKRGAGN